MEYRRLTKAERIGDRLILQGKRQPVIVAENIEALKIRGKDIFARVLNSDDDKIGYFEGDFPIKSVDVYEVEEGRFLGLDEIKTLTPIAHLTDEAYTTIPNTKDGRHWLILVCHIELEA